MMGWGGCRRAGWAILAGAMGLTALGCRPGKPDAAAAALQEVDPQLRALVDSLMPELQRLSGLKQLAPIHMARRNAAQVRAFVDQQLTRNLPPDQLEGMRKTYVALGLMPDTLRLRDLLLDLYTEQIVGYYDPQTKQLYVVDGVSRDALEPVLAHELVHALQDQHTNLDSLISRYRGNDRQGSAQAAIEGHAMMVMFALLAERATGRTLDPRLLPNPTSELRAGLEAQNQHFPVFRRAPPIIRESLLFPYIDGANFIYALWQSTPPRGPLPAPLDTLLPQSTEQVLFPRARFLLHRDPPTELRFSGASPWKTLYENTFGEFETSVFLSQYLGTEGSEAARGWDGDRFRLLQSPSGGEVLVWYTLWDDTTYAGHFTNAVEKIQAQRNGRHATVSRSLLDGIPLVRVVDGDARITLGDLPDLPVTIVAGNPPTDSPPAPGSAPRSPQ